MKHGVILLGAPGAGKGTQAAILVEKFQIPHISSGDMFRVIRKSDTELGRQVAAIMDSGALVTDDVTIQIVRARLSNPDCQSGFILDGFPRTRSQALALDEMLKDIRQAITIVPYLHVRSELLVERLSNRWICDTCSSVYTMKPYDNKTCKKPSCSGMLFRRRDDEPATVAQRVKVFEENTAPLIEYYSMCGLLKQLDGEQSVADVTKSLLAEIQGQ
jgi:adenylate kinase